MHNILYNLSYIYIYIYIVKSNSKNKWNFCDYRLLLSISSNLRRLWRNTENFKRIWYNWMKFIQIIRNLMKSNVFVLICARFTRFSDRTRSSDFFDGNKKSDWPNTQTLTPARTIIQNWKSISWECWPPFPEEEVKIQICPNTMPHLYGKRTCCYGTSTNDRLFDFYNNFCYNIYIN